MTRNSETIAATVERLAAARAPGAAIVPPDRELSAAEAWAIHQAGVARLGPVAGWKTGAPTQDAEPMYGEISADTLLASPASVPARSLRLWAVEAEIAVTFARDLPGRSKPYEATDILAAVASWHAAIEVLDTAFADWKAAPPLWKMADRQSHGVLVLGAGSARPPLGPLDAAPVRLLIDGATAYAHQGGNTAGDPTRLLVSLANRLAATERPIRAGDVVTTGSTTPFRQVSAGQRVRVEFDGLAPAELAVAG